MLCFFRFWGTFSANSNPLFISVVGYPLRCRVVCSSLKRVFLRCLYIHIYNCPLSFFFFSLILQIFSLCMSEFIYIYIYSHTSSTSLELHEPSHIFYNCIIPNTLSLVIIYILHIYIYILKLI